MSGNRGHKNLKPPVMRIAQAQDRDRQCVKLNVH